MSDQEARRPSPADRATIMVFTPSRGVVDIKWHYHTLNVLQSSIPPMCSYAITITDRRKLVESFNSAAEEAVKAGVKYLAILEDDVFMPAGSFGRLIRRLQEHPDHGIATGVYFMKRSQGCYPLVFRAWESGADWTWKPGEVILDAAGGSQGLSVVDCEIFQRMERPWFRWDWEYERADGSKVPFPRSADLYLFYACKHQAGKKILVDCGVLAEHHCRVRNRFFPDDPEIRKTYGYPKLPPFLNPGEMGLPSDMKELETLGCRGVCATCGEEIWGEACEHCGCGLVIG
jgi:hypothetical protein